MTTEKSKRKKTANTSDVNRNHAPSRLVSSRLGNVFQTCLGLGFFFNCVCVCVMTAYRTYLSETVNRKKKRGEEEQSQDGKEWWR